MPTATSSIAATEHHRTTHYENRSRLWRFVSELRVETVRKVPEVPENEAQQDIATASFGPFSVSYDAQAHGVSLLEPLFGQFLDGVLRSLVAAHRFQALLHSSSQLNHTTRYPTARTDISSVGSSDSQTKTDRS